MLSFSIRRLSLSRTFVSKSLNKTVLDRHTDDLISLIKVGDIDSAQEILTYASENIDFTLTDTYGSTALTLASRGGHFDLCKDILEKINHCPSVLNQQNMFGSTALMCASASGHDEICQLLLLAGANVDIRTRYGSTALSKAAEAGHASIVTQLMAVGASAIENVMGKTPWDLARENGHDIHPPSPEEFNETELSVAATVRRIISSTQVEVEINGGFSRIVSKSENSLIPINAQVQVNSKGECTYSKQKARVKQQCLHPKRKWDKKCVDCPDKRK